ncbi:MAG TPA: hypothetical protein VD996_17390 [Chitinophagaceae bacterium]|nr:hypothetical protein [Chitinophagaceae bacterium]
MTKIKGPQFVLIEDPETSQHYIRCMYPLIFKTYIFFRTDKPDSFYLVPEKDSPHIRRIVKNMNSWFQKEMQKKRNLQ